MQYGEDLCLIKFLGASLYSHYWYLYLELYYFSFYLKNIKNLLKQNGQKYTYSVDFY